MRRLAPTPESLAWLGVAVAGLIVVAIVLGLRLVPRLAAGQQLIDDAGPAMTDERVAGARAGADFISRYVDVADPLLTARGGGARERATLIGLVARRTPLTEREAAALLRRTAPRLDGLLRAAPLSAAARETPRLTGYLATRLGVSEDEVAATLEGDFPRLAQTLTALRSVTSGWNDMPGTEGLTRFDATRQVRTVPQMRDLLDDDLVAALERSGRDFRSLSGSGGVGYIAWLLLAVGVLAVGAGLVQARRARTAPPGRLSWSVVAAPGVLLIVVVVALQLFGRLGATDDALADLQPAFEDQRAQGIRAGVDMLHQAVLFGDPIATRRDGGSTDVRRFVAFVSRRTNVSPDRVRAELRRRAPRTAALLAAVPLSTTSAEVPRLLTVLARRMRLSRSQLVATLRRSTPRLAQSILGLEALARGWRAIPGTAGFRRFDGTPARRMPALQAYFAEDVVPVLEDRGESLRDFREPWPPLDVLAPLVLAIGMVLALYGLLGMAATRP